jgi:UDP-glucuronate decarboxylase
MAAESANVGQGEMMNIGGGHNYSVNDIADKIGGEKEYIALRIEPHDTLADILQAKELIGWQPQVNMDEGLANTIKWFEEKFNCKIK